MSACCPGDVKAITTISGTTVTTQYLDMRVSPPVLMDQAAYDALTKVKCATSEPDKERVCLQPTGNTDAALIVPGWSISVINTTYADTAGTVDTVSIGSATLWLDDGTEVTDTHEIVKCPEPVVIESEHCVAA